MTVGGFTQHVAFRWVISVMFLQLTYCISSLDSVGISISVENYISYKKNRRATEKMTRGHSLGSGRLNGADYSSFSSSRKRRRPTTVDTSSARRPMLVRCFCRSRLVSFRASRIDRTAHRTTHGVKTNPWSPGFST